jgi:hypothetical protein
MGRCQGGVKVLGWGFRASSVKVLIFSGLRKHDCCQIKTARKPSDWGKKTAQSAKTAPHHMKTPT